MSRRSPHPLKSEQFLLLKLMTPSIGITEGKLSSNRLDTRRNIIKQQYACTGSERLGHNGFMTRKRIDRLRSPSFSGMMFLTTMHPIASSSTWSNSWLLLYGSIKLERTWFL